MNSDWAAEHLRTIRTLMERSTVYRRALAPIMILAGALGLGGGVAGVALRISGMRAFGVLWFVIALAALAGAFVIARRQAFRDQEAFWSPPTRRVTQALLPPLTAGFALTFPLVALPGHEDPVLLYVLLCVFFYGCALHAAGFFMPRGISLLGWLFISGGIALTALLALLNPGWEAREGHVVMGSFFGLLQLAYGIYLHATQKREPAA